MSFLFGATMLFAAFVLISVCRAILNRPGATRDPQAFGVAEAIAYLFTGLTATGLASITIAAAQGRMPSVLIELAVAMAVLVAACVLVGFGLARLYPRALAPGAAAEVPPTPPGNRAGRTATEPRPGKPAGSKHRAA